MKYITNLDENCMEDIKNLGGKARNLVELCKIKEINVPRGVCVKSIAFDEFSNPICLPSFIYKINDIKGSSVEIKKNIKHQPISKQMIREIMNGIENLREPFVVRSSAILEDSKKYSFAGQQDSFLNVKRIDVMDAIKSCWASLYNSRALSYRLNIGIEEIGSIGVVIQEMILAEKSGVIATAHPITGNKDNILINANWGFGETVVLGEVNPDEYYIRKIDSKILRRTINKKTIMECLEKGKLIKKDICNDPKSEQSCLSDKDILDLCHASLKIEEYFKRNYDIENQDIEFVIDHKINIVQSRPLQLGKQKH